MPQATAAVYTPQAGLPAFFMRSSSIVLHLINHERESIMKATKHLFLFAALLLGTSSMLAQGGSGQVHGVVKDASSGDVLPGANVQLKGTSLGASVNLNGAYVIRSIPPGPYTLVARYLGYRSVEVPIDVKAGVDLEHDFSLTVQAIEGQEVVVLAQAKGQMEAINQQLTSNSDYQRGLRGKNPRVAGCKCSLCVEPTARRFHHEWRSNCHSGNSGEE